MLLNPPDVLGTSSWPIFSSSVIDLSVRSTHDAAFTAEAQRAQRLKQRTIAARIRLMHQIVYRGEDRFAIRLRPVIAVGAVCRAMFFAGDGDRLRVEPFVSAVALEYVAHHERGRAAGHIFVDERDAIRFLQ